MKKLIIPTILACAMAACTSETVEPTTTADKVEVTFQVDCPLMISMEDITKATLAEARAKNVYALVDGELMKAQASSENEFGTYTLTLPVGSHTITTVVSADTLTAAISNGKVVSFASKGDKVHDCFANTYTLDVTHNTTAQEVTVDRIVAKVLFEVLDAIPEGVTGAEIVVSDRTKAFNTSFIGITPSSTAYHVDVPASFIGKTKSLISIMTFCPSLTEDFSKNVCLTLTDANGNTVGSRSADNIPMHVNTVTKVSGRWFSGEPAYSVSVNTSWNANKEVNI